MDETSRPWVAAMKVSMKSGLEGRNNGNRWIPVVNSLIVSMKSGLEGRNNNIDFSNTAAEVIAVSMKSGLEGRNN